jgi:hypothetical protein
MATRCDLGSGQGRTDDLPDRRRPGSGRLADRRTSSRPGRARLTRLRRGREPGNEREAAWTTPGPAKSGLMTRRPLDRQVEACLLVLAYRVPFCLRVDHRPPRQPAVELRESGEVAAFQCHSAQVSSTTAHNGQPTRRLGEDPTTIAIETGRVPLLRGPHRQVTPGSKQELGKRARRGGSVEPAGTFWSSLQIPSIL